MAKRKDIDNLLANWPYQPGDVMARVVKASDGREVLQMRIDLGVMQLEVDGRPDGARPQGAETYFDYLLSLVIHKGDDFVLTVEQCAEADREFVQFYHRRICWLTLRRFRKAVKDADHTLGFMDFAKQHSPDEEWTLSHEQYRPFVLFHRIQAAALAVLEDQGPEAAIGEINRGLDRFRSLFEEYDAGERFDDDELVKRLVELQDSLRNHYKVGRTLDEQLADAVAAEQYELAAKLRDKIAGRGSKRN
ncbi:MAG: UvrB/UvrC motif-containing protein [Pirellulales bacterium]|nr:UvrB/UvrC motif-containing protein [Pirellulales bacterium]